MGLLLLCVTLTVITFPSQTCGKAIACTAGDFQAGANASIVCYFPDDIDNHDSVYIQYFPFTAPIDASETAVLLCKAEELKSSTCKGKDEYVLKRYTRNTVLVGIVNVTKKAAGQYLCQFVPPTHSPIDMCNLTVHGAVPPASADKPNWEHQDSFADSAEIVVVIVILCVLIVLAVLACCIRNRPIFFRRRTRLKERCRKENVESDVEDISYPLIDLNNRPVVELPTVHQESKERQCDQAPPLIHKPDQRTTYVTLTPGPVVKLPTVYQESKESSAVLTPSVREQTTSNSVVGRLSSTRRVPRWRIGERPPDIWASCEYRISSPGPTSDDSTRTGVAVTRHVQDDNKMGSMVDLLVPKSSDTHKSKGADSGKHNSSESLAGLNIDSSNLEEIKNHVSSARESEKLDIVSLFSRMYSVLDRVEKRLDDIKEVEPDSAIRLVPYQATQTSEHILKELLQELRDSGTHLQREAERQIDLGKPWLQQHVHPVVSCVHKILEHVEHGQVDAQTHEDIRNLGINHR